MSDEYWTIFQEWVSMLGLRARCGMKGCPEVLLFQNTEDAVTCHKCGATCDIYGAKPEYHTLIVRAIQVADDNPSDRLVNGLAAEGWAVDQMQVIQEPNAGYILLVYLLKRLVARLVYRKLGG